MKLSFPLLLLTLFSFNVISAQTEPTVPAVDYNKVYEMFDIQKEASPAGGITELYKYLADSLKYPVLAREKGISGVVALTFIVDTNGDLYDFNIVKDIGGGCGKEAVRVLDSMPPWVPGELNGRKVKVRYTMPVRFRYN